jgi:hypothetical protein
MSVLASMPQAMPCGATRRADSSTSSPPPEPRFHAHLFQCAQRGTPRLTWAIDYLAWPGLRDVDRMRLVRDMTLDDVEFDHEDYDRDRWPVSREWAAGTGTSPSRALAMERLRLLGVSGGQLSRRRARTMTRRR